MLIFEWIVYLHAHEACRCLPLAQRYVCWHCLVFFYTDESGAC